MTVRLPLFPLGTVLFPHALLPLHVFEERYRRLVRDLISAPEDERHFGVVAIREGREVGSQSVRALHAVGCVAELRRVEPYADGRFDIVSGGAQRFRLVAVEDARPYLRAEVELLGEPAGDSAGSLVAPVQSLFARYRELLGVGSRDEAPDLPHDPSTLSYLVASATVLDLGDRQRLLEVPDTAGRLQQELRLLRREISMLRRLPSLPGVELTRVPANPN